MHNKEEDRPYGNGYVLDGKFRRTLESAITYLLGQGFSIEESYSYLKALTKEGKK